MLSTNIRKKMLIQIGLNKFVNDLIMMTNKCRTSKLITLIYIGNFFFLSIKSLRKANKQKIGLNSDVFL